MNANVATTILSPARAERPPAWLWIAAGLGTLWNAYGVWQFLQSVRATRESLVAMGMTETQAAAMSSYPVWMTAAFAVGTMGGLAGCLLLGLRRRQASAVFLASLMGYIVLYVGDITEGIFAATGISQVVILSLVVAIAAALLRVSRRAGRLGLLT